MIWRGILIPGGASLYVGATDLGIFRAVFETILLLTVFFLCSVQSARQLPPTPRPT